MSDVLTEFFDGLAKSHDVVRRCASYCDYIAYRIKSELSLPDPQRLIANVGQVKWDLHPTEGWFVSTKKTIEVEDRNGKRYRVTVEEIA